MNDRQKNMGNNLKALNQSDSFSAWSKMQQNELNERVGDGYSPWEYAIDTVKGIPEIIGRAATDGYRGGFSNMGPQNQLLDKMRSISDKGQGYKPNQQEQNSVNSWENLKLTGKTRF